MAGIEVVDLQQAAVGVQANNLRVLPQYRRTLQEQLLAAKAAGVDALVAVYHSDHRELCAQQASLSADLSMRWLSSRTASPRRSTKRADIRNQSLGVCRTAISRTRRGRLST